MDFFVARRASDPRFSRPRVDASASTAVSAWYAAPPRPVVASATTTRHLNAMAEAKADPAPKEKKKKKRKKDADEGGNASTSDGTDGGRCWYARPVASSFRVRAHLSDAWQE